MKTEKYNVEGMMCAACSASVERVVGKLKGVKSVTVNLLQKNMTVTYNEKEVTPEQICETVAKAGFSASLASAPKKEKPKGENMKLRLIGSICFLVVLMYLSMGSMWGLPQPAFLKGTENGVSFAFMQFLLCLPIIYLNRKFYINGFKALAHKAPNMDSLVAVGSASALFYGIIAIFRMSCGLGAGDLELVESYRSNLYFESAAMILTLITVGKTLEERSKGKTSMAVDKLKSIPGKNAAVLVNGVEMQKPVENLAVGDLLIIRPGEAIPVDGEVVNGASAVDESAITGESVPVDKSAGDKVISATINKNGTLTVKAERVGGDTTLSNIIKLMEDASSSKPKIARLADKIAGIFVPAVMSIALVTFIVWLILGRGIEFALNCAISVLVISCPCALGLATPVAITVSCGRCAQFGILIKSAESLERLHSVKYAVMDKTGTITEGKPAVTDIVPAADEQLLKSVALSLEAKSEHPISLAITENITADKKDVTDFVAAAGKGVVGTINGQKALGGNIRLLQDNGIGITPLTELENQGKTVTYFALNGVYLGAVAVADRVRETSKEAIEKIKEMGLTPVMLTGDGRGAAEFVAKQVGIEEYKYSLLPSDKEKIVAEYVAKGGACMVGDGINDAPALMRADVGLAVKSGTDIAMDSADIVLMKNDLGDVAHAISFSKKTIRNIKQNLFWAFFYNALGIPLAAGVFSHFGITLNPMIGAAAMSLSSIFVVTNALRLFKMK